MRLLFTPAIALMNRLGYTKKFALLALMSVAAFSVVGYSLFVSLNKEISVLQRELEGIKLIGRVPKIVQLMQQHRGLSAGALSGVETMRDKRATKEKKVVEAFHEMEVALPANLIAGDDWRSIMANWERLREKGLDLTQAECFTMHTRLIGQILLFRVAVADEYALTLDPEIDSYYLIDTIVNKLPQVIEYLAQLRAYGIANLADKQITEPEKMAIGAVIGKLGDALGAFEINVEKAARYNPALQNSLLATARNIAGSAHQVTGLVEADILTGRLATSPEDFYATTSAAIDASYSQMYGSLLSATETLLKARIVRAENTMRISIGIAILLLLVVTYFAIGIYHSIIDSVRSLARSAHTFAGGDMRERIRLDTRDELGQVGDSFNKMADSFNAMHDRLRDSRDDLHRLLNSMAEGVYGVDTDGNCTFVNQSFLRMLGYRNENELLGKNMHELIHHAHADGSPHPASECKIYRAYQTNQTANVADEVFWRKDGVAIPVEYWSHPIMTGGVVTGSIVTFVDITERKQAEDAVRKSNDLLQSVVENAPARIFWKDRDSRYLGCNTQLAKDAGYSSPGELTGKTDFDMGWKNQAELYRADDRAVMESGNPKLDYEEPQTTPDGNMIWLRTSKVPLRDRSNRVIGILGVYEDITERKQAEDKLRKYNEELEAINHQLQDTQNQLLQSEKMASIGQLAAGVAHEINNPIGYVYSNLGTLEKYVKDTFGMIDLYEQAEGAIGDAAVRARLRAARDKLDIEFLKEDLHALMNESKDGITRVKKIVQNLKDFSHVDASDEWHFADLHNGLESTLNIVNNEIKYKADVVREYGDIPEVECLSSQLNQVFMNLLVNAAHAIEERGTITVRTGTVRTEQQGEEVWVEIADTGKGIAPEHLKKIFDPFFTTKPIGKGTGLGLSLSYSIIQKHHGRIEVQSEPGKGTAFRVWLPVKQPQEEQA